MRRFAAILAVVGIALIGAAPTANALEVPNLLYVANSNGGSAVVNAVVHANGDIDLTSTKGLSRVTVVLCTGVTVVFDNWNGEQLAATVHVDGAVRAVFIHSGDNTTAEAQALLALLAGADAVKGDSTGAIAFNSDEACQPTTTTTQPPTTTTTQPPVVTTTTTAPPVTTTTQPPVTTTTLPGTTVTTTAPPAPGTDVQGTNVEKPVVNPQPVGQLPHTGAASGILAILGGGLVLAGLILFGLSFMAKRAAQA